MIGDSIPSYQVELLNELKHGKEQLEETRKSARATTSLLSQTLGATVAAADQTITAPMSMNLQAVGPEQQPATARLRATQSLPPLQQDPRFHARHWWAPLPNEQLPLKKLPHQTWNSVDSHFPDARKGRDHLFRATSTQEEAEDDWRLKEDEDAQKEKKEYYPNRQNLPPMTVWNLEHQCISLDATSEK